MDPNLNVRWRVQVPRVPGERPAQVPSLHSSRPDGRDQKVEGAKFSHAPPRTRRREEGREWEEGRGRGGEGREGCGASSPPTPPPPGLPLPPAADWEEGPRLPHHNGRLGSESRPHGAPSRVQVPGPRPPHAPACLAALPMTALPPTPWNLETLFTPRNTPTTSQGAPRWPAGPCDDRHLEPSGPPPHPQPQGARGV